MAPPLREKDVKVKEADRARYQDEATSLGKKVADALSATSGIDDKAVWEAYAGTEKLIAVLRYRLDYETPGVFTKLPDASDPAGLLQEARAQLLAAAEELSARNMIEAVETLRKARNNLRSYLTEKRKAETKAQRRTRGVPSTG